jgi:hypothetical protein
MDAPTTIATVLLDGSPAEEFMSAYKRERPARWEFERGLVSNEIFSVKRWDWEGSYSYIGCVRRSGDRWWTHAVAPRTFYGRDSGQVLSVRHEYVSHVGPFDTKEQAAEKLWELYESPR